MITKKQRQEVSKKIDKITTKKTLKKWNKKKVRDIEDEPIFPEK